MPGSEVAFRKELDASVPANLGSVRAFYRSELEKRGWKEATDHAVVKSDSAQLAYATPDGPAALKLGRSNGKTTVNLVQKIPVATATVTSSRNPVRRGRCSQLWRRRSYADHQRADHQARARRGQPARQGTVTRSAAK